MSDNFHVSLKTREEIAAYIRDMTIELAAMARAAQCDTLNSVLELAEKEASRLAEPANANGRQTLENRSPLTR